MKRSKGKQGYMALNLDMEKAYDRMEWGFILKIMEKLGFCEKWIGLISECISSPTFSILINGFPLGSISPSRGLRQGDPLSPFLFILGTEVLSRLLVNVENNGSFKGFPLARTCPRVSHLLFADDLIIFAQASVVDVGVIQSCIDKYQECSGKLVNVKKSAIMFTHKVPRSCQRAFCREVSLKSAPFHAKYLGLPLCNEKSWSCTLEHVIERVSNKVQGWKQKIMSQASRLCLIKVVAAATPVYPMSSWSFPKHTCAKIDSILRDFWWGVKEGKRGFYFKAWDSMCVPKSVGGLGIRRSADMNNALLAKLGWQVANRDDKPWVQYVVAKYLRGQSFWSVKVRHEAS
jgi:hypothetical protein